MLDPGAFVVAQVERRFERLQIARRVFGLPTPIVLWLNLSQTLAVVGGGVHGRSLLGEQRFRNALVGDRRALDTPQKHCHMRGPDGAYDSYFTRH